MKTADKLKEMGFRHNKAYIRVKEKTGADFNNKKLGPVACYSQLTSRQWKSIRVYNFKCKATEQYADEYLQMINEIHPIKIGKSYIGLKKGDLTTIKAKYILFLVRYLFESTTDNYGLGFHPERMIERAVKIYKNKANDLDALESILTSYSEECAIRAKNSSWNSVGHHLICNFDYKIAIHSIKDWKKWDGKSLINSFSSKKQ